MRKLKRRYRYVLVDECGKVHFSTNELYVALSEANFRNLELRQNLPNVTVGRHKFEHRYKVLRKITSQEDLFKITERVE